MPVKDLPDYITDMTNFKSEKTIAEQLRLVSNFYLYFPSVKTVIDTLTSLVLTDLDTTIEEDVDGKVNDILYDKMDIMNVLRRVITEFFIYGNVFTGVTLPTDKKFKCPKCGKDQYLFSYDDVGKYEMNDKEIELTCKSCRGKIRILVNDIKEISAGASKIDPGMRPPEITIYNVKHISLITAPGSNRKRAVYTLSVDEKNAIRKGKYIFVLKNSPLAFIKAATERKASVVIGESVLHVHDSDISGTTKEGWGVIPLMSAYKLIYYLAALRRQNIELAALRPSPVHLVSPAPEMADHADLEDIKTNIENSLDDAFKSGKRQPTVFIPAPVNVQTLFADYKPLNLVGEIKLAQNELAVSIGLPADLVYGGGARWSAASANIRMLEKRFVFLYDALGRICDRVATVVGSLTATSITIKPVRLRVMDDVAILNILLKLVAANRASYDTLLSRMGLDPEDEIDKIEKQIKKLSDIDIKQNKMMADAQREHGQQSMEDELRFRASVQSSGQPTANKQPKENVQPKQEKLQTAAQKKTPQETAALPEKLPPRREGA